jgi:hypothetical protein
MVGALPIAFTRQEVFMDDLDYLSRRQQQERARARSSNCTQAHSAHEQMAASYQEQIGHLTNGRVIIQPRDTFG